MTKEPTPSAEEESSDFGKGLCYCLALFLEHKHKLYSEITLYKEYKREEWIAVEMWFNGAADHLFDFDTDKAPEGLKERCTILKNKCLGWRLSYNGGHPTQKDAEWAIGEAEELIRLIDESHGVPTTEATWK